MKIIFLLILAMCAFAANSVIGRLAMDSNTIDPASYSLLRLISGAVMLTIVVSISNGVSDKALRQGNWFSAAALFCYAVAFSYAYIELDAGIGALILFACVQLTMIGWALIKGDRPSVIEWFGMIVAFAAFIWLVSPGFSAPDPFGAILMALSGVAWGVYSIRGQGVKDALKATAGNFILSAPFALILTIFVYSDLNYSQFGAFMAIFSGAFTSGLGYALWYRVLVNITQTQAAIVQLTVPVIAGFGGTLFLAEGWNLRFAISSVLILGGVAITTLAKAKRA